MSRKEGVAGVGKSPLYRSWCVYLFRANPGRQRTMALSIFVQLLSCLGEKAALLPAESRQKVMSRDQHYRILPASPQNTWVLFCLYLNTWFLFKLLIIIFFSSHSLIFWDENFSGGLFSSLAKTSLWINPKGVNCVKMMLPMSLVSTSAQDIACKTKILLQLFFWLPRWNKA